MEIYREPLLTAEEAAEILGYKHVGAFKRAVRRRVLRHVRPVPRREITDSHDYRRNYYRLSDVRRQAEEGWDGRWRLDREVEKRRNH